MRASKEIIQTNEEQHVSGAERLVSEKDLKKNLIQLLNRALTHPLGPIDRINFSVAKINKNHLLKKTALPVFTVKVEDKYQGMSLLKYILGYLGVRKDAIEQSALWLQNGGVPGGGNMSGAILYHVDEMERLEDSYIKGVRVTNMDMTINAEKKLNKALKAQNSYSPRTRDALVLATKISSYPGVIAEACISDDPYHLGGYIASNRIGYVRISHMKSNGHHFGGRVIYLNIEKCNVGEFINYLRNELMIITKISNINQFDSLEDFINAIKLI